jgi:hydrogenase maturation protein HypF
MACAWLTEPRPLPWLLEGVVDRERWSQVAEVSRSELVSPTTSIGRLFDAVAALCGIGPRASYEGQAAVELEAATASGERGTYDLPALESAGQICLDARETIGRVARDVDRGIDPGTVSARFHRAVANATASSCAALAERHSLGTVVLSGGVFQNRRLLEAVAARLDELGLRALVPRRLPPNDGGISYGQAAVAACGRWSSPASVDS